MSLDFALRCAWAGHSVRVYRHMPKKRERYGEGFKELTLVDDWRPSMSWAKSGLIVLTGNFTLLHELDRYREFGFPIFAPTVQSARLEIDRMAGMEAAKAAGLAVPSYQVFASLEDTRAFNRKQDRAWVFKPAGDEENKDLTFVSNDPGELDEWLGRQIAAGRKMKQCLLQEKVEVLSELGVSGWMGPEGFLPEKWGLSIEHKKLCDGENGPNCFTADSEVLTKEGWKYWPEVDADDEICTLKDGLICYEKPARVVVGDFDGNLVGWQSPYCDILVTPGHNMYVQDDHYRRPFFFEPASVSAENRRTLMRAGGEWKGAPAELAGAEAEAALLGIYIADGYARQSEVIFSNISPRKIDVFGKIIANAGYGYKIRAGNSIVIAGRLAECFRCYGLAHQKYVPTHIKDAERSVIEAFLYGYGEGDGSTRYGNLTYTTVSRRLADDLQELALKVGWAASVHERDRRDEPPHLINGYECFNRRACYDVGISKKRVKCEISPETMYRLPYSGKVYCVTVTSHVIYVRRNGKACWIGQTGEMATVGQYVTTDKLQEEMLAPLEPVLRTLGHRGDFAVGAIVDKKGKAWFLEVTARFGYPAWWLQIASHKGDPAKWMKDLMGGRDSLRVSHDVAIVVVCTQPPFPYTHNVPGDMVEGNPIYGTEGIEDQIHLASVMRGQGSKFENGKIVQGPLLQTTGAYVLACTGLGKTVTKAREKVYAATKQVKFPAKIIRTDAGEKVIDALPDLHKFGYCLDMAP